MKSERVARKNRWVGKPKGEDDRVAEIWEAGSQGNREIGGETEWAERNPRSAEKAIREGICQQSQQA